MSDAKISKIIRKNSKDFDAIVDALAEAGYTVVEGPYGTGHPCFEYRWGSGSVTTYQVHDTDKSYHEESPEHDVDYEYEEYE